MLGLVKEKILDVSQYEARNGFGARVTVTKGMSEHLGFTLEGERAELFGQVLDGGFTVSVLRGKAQIIKAKRQKLVLVISGQIAGLPKQAFESVEPTFATPLEASILYSNLRLKATELSVRVAETNELLGFFDGLP